MTLRLLSKVYFCGVVDNKNGWTYQTAEFIDNRFTPRYNRFICFLLWVPQTSTCLRPLHYVVLLHDFNVSFKVLPLLSRNSLLAVIPWRHRLVTILWLNPQQNSFCVASKRMRRLIGASDLRPIYNNILMPYASNIGLQWRWTTILLYNGFGG